jgi:hypothetical protein
VATQVKGFLHPRALRLPGSGAATHVLRLPWTPAQHLHQPIHSRASKPAGRTHLAVPALKTTWPSFFCHGTVPASSPRSASVSCVAARPLSRMSGVLYSPSASQQLHRGTLGRGLDQAPCHPRLGAMVAASRFVLLPLGQRCRRKQSGGSIRVSPMYRFERRKRKDHKSVRADYEVRRRAADENVL